MNNGTLTNIPVSMIASLVALVAVLPLIPGSVLVITKSILLRAFLITKIFWSLEPLNNQDNNSI